MTWKDMVEIEPELQEMFGYAKSLDGSEKNFCANRIFYDELKPAIENLVGWGARNSLLKSKKCYDKAYNKIWKALPPCKDCGCL